MFIHSDCPLVETLYYSSPSPVVSAKRPASRSKHPPCRNSIPRYRKDLVSLELAVSMCAVRINLGYEDI